MIGEALRTEIEAYAARRRENPVFRAAEEGRLTRAMVKRYVANVGYMVGITPANLRRACERARAKGDEKLAAYFAKKLREETGHHLWAERDLEALSSTTLAVEQDCTVTAAIEELARYLEETIDRDPALYLPYIAFAEYITVIIGPEWLALVEERCGTPRSAITIIDNHIELDREHAEEAFACIDDFVSDPKMLAPMREVLHRSLAYFDRFCAEVVDTAEASDERVAHVSAA